MTISRANIAQRTTPSRGFRLAVFWLVCGLIAGLSTGARAVSLPAVGDIGVDFRDAVWSGCPTPGPDPACTVGDITLTASPNNPGFFWAADDGFGIADFFFFGGENDEIDGSESLTVDFAEPVSLAGVWLTDIFAGSDGGDGEQANVQVTLNDNSILDFSFSGTEPEGVNNGGLFGSFEAALDVIKVVFSSTGEANDEYSVAGFEVAEAPLPGALGFLLFGIATLGVIARRRRVT
jgi:hypothetical protein